MANFWNRLFATIHFTAQGGRYERFLTLCTQQGIPIINVQPIPGGVCATVPARYYKQCSVHARRCRTRLNVTKRQGLWFQLKGYHGRWGLLLGPIVFLVSIGMMQQMLWSIRYDSSLTQPQQQTIQQLLYSMDIYEGAILTQEKLVQTEKMLLSQTAEFSWISLNFAKGRLVVEAVPAANKPEIEGNEAVDLVAKESGTILEINVQEGFAVKTRGQTVAQGELLIAAGKEDYSKTNIESHAKGTVTAQVKKTYLCTQPLQYTALIPTGEIEERLSVKIGTKQYFLQKEIALPQSLKKITHKQLSVLGFCLPATLEEEVVVPRVQTTISLQPKQAEQFAKMACMQQFYSEFPDAQILSMQEESTTEQGDLTYKITLEFIADIAN